MSGRHSDELRLEDHPSRNPAASLAWWRPRHRADGWALTSTGSVPPALPR